MRVTGSQVALIPVPGGRQEPEGQGRINTPDWLTWVRDYLSKRNPRRNEEKQPFIKIENRPSCRRRVSGGIGGGSRPRRVPPCHYPPPPPLGTPAPDPERSGKGPQWEVRREGSRHRYDPVAGRSDRPPPRRRTHPGWPRPSALNPTPKGLVPPRRDSSRPGSSPSFVSYEPRKNRGGNRGGMTPQIPRESSTDVT